MISFAAGILIFQQSSQAQTCGLPPDETTITTSNRQTLDVTYSLDADNYCYASFVGDGYCLSISWWHDGMEGITVEINNSDSDWAHGPGIIALNNMWGGEPWGGVVDLNALPPDYRELWEQCMETSGDLLESDEFYELLDKADKDKIEEVIQTLEWTRDGYYAPSGMEQFFTVSFFTGAWACDFEPGRGYSFEGPITFRISTPDVIGAEYPQIYIDADLNLHDNLTFHINPDTETIEIQLWNAESVDELTESDYEPIIEDLIHAINFFLGQEFVLIENGLIGEDDDYGLLLEKALEGLNSWPVEVVIPEYPDI